MNRAVPSLTSPAMNAINNVHGRMPYLFKSVRISLLLPLVRAVVAVAVACSCCWFSMICIYCCELFFFSCSLWQFLEPASAQLRCSDIHSSAFKLHYAKESTFEFLLNVFLCERLQWIYKSPVSSPTQKSCTFERTECTNNTVIWLYGRAEITEQIERSVTKWEY